MSSKPSHLERLLQNNALFAQSYTAPMTMSQLRPAVTDPVLVLTCMDPRVIPEQFLGPQALIAVFRNAGGRPNADVVRTIAVLQSLVVNAEKVTVMVVHHTDCGMTHLTDEEIKSDVKKRVPEEAERVEGIEFGCFAAEDFEKTILEDVETLRTDKLLRGVEVRGFALSTETGVLKEL